MNNRFDKLNELARVHTCRAVSRHWPANRPEVFGTKVIDDSRFTRTIDDNRFADFVIFTSTIRLESSLESTRCVCCVRNELQR